MTWPIMSDETPREERPQRPTPIREAVGDAGEAQLGSDDRRPDARGDRPTRAGAHGPSLGRASSPPGLRGQKERPAGPKPTGSARADRKPKRPVSARVSVEGAGSQPPLPEDMPSRTFSTNGAEWIVRLSGKAFAGFTSRSSAPLLELTFYRPEAPTSAVSRTLTVGRSLDGVADESLARLLEEARPVSDSPDRT
ncbi:MAG: hypothetical protein BMS9Abin29_1686 [Gemmatimonadota bacterium]|nr:MAG: hypothetical protein BMS9Abin29_1686 [Gemmatimonadota bacterium]